MGRRKDSAPEIFLEKKIGEKVHISAKNLRVVSICKFHIIENNIALCFITLLLCFLS